jgi:hypothetical protein
MNSWTVRIEAFNRRRAIAHGWGKLQGSGDPPTKAWLDRRRDGVSICKIPVVFGRHQRDKDGLITIDVVFHGILQAIPDKQDAFILVMEWPSKQQMELPAPFPCDIAPKHGAARITHLPWRHYLSRGMRLIRQGQSGLLIRKAAKMAFTFFFSSWSAARLLRKMAAEGKPLALVIDHDLGGGANLYRRSLMEQLTSEGFTPVLLTAHHGLLVYQLSGTLPGRTATAHVEDLSALFDDLSGTDFKRVIFNNMVSFPEPLALAQALANWLKKKQIEQFLFLMHDHYCICPSWLLLNEAGNYCGVPDISICANCLPANTSPFLEFSYGADITFWRKTWDALLKEASEIRCFSNTTRNLLIRAHADLDPRKISVVPHTLDHVRLRKVIVKDSGRPIVGIVGEINRHKGGLVVRELAEYIEATGKNVHIVVVGTIECKLPKGVTITGPYVQKQLPELLEKHGINVGFFPSIWPETFSYVTEEMIKMGLPLLAFDLGAPGERVSRYAYGQVIPLGSPRATLEAIEILYGEHVTNRQIR